MAARADPTRIGDASILQSDLIGARMSHEARARVERLCRERGLGVLRPAIDDDALRRLPPGTFGRALIDFCHANGIQRATVSPAIDDDELRRTPAIARYIVIHDMLHVLLDCDTSIPEELRITAFILAQRSFGASRPWLVILYLVGPLLQPHQARRVLDNIRRGRALARSAPFLLAEPLEDFFAHELEPLRQRLGLAAAPAPAP
jgi:ubiquinone biosynthesis protein Coq4